MHSKNIDLVLELGELSKKDYVRFFFFDNRWKKSGDVDLFILKKDLDKFHEIVTQKGFYCYKSVQYWKINYRKYSNGEIISLHLHIGCCEGFVKGILDPNKVKGFLPPEEQLFYFMFRVALDRPVSKYMPYLPGLLKKIKDKEKLKQYFRMMFINYESTYNLVIQGKWQSVKPKFRLNYNLKRLMCAVRNTIFNIFFKNIIRLNKLAPYVIIMGTDGSGKTSLVRNVKTTFEKAHKMKVYTHYGGRFKFQCLPLNLFSRNVMNTVKKKKKIEGHIVNYESNFVSTLTPFIYYFEYLLRYLFFIFPKRIKNHLVIEDRYFLDLVVSKNANPKLVKFFYHLLPKPNKIIYLYQNIDTIIKRRLDHPASDLIFQQKRFKNLDFDLKIKTITEQDTLDQAMSLIMKELKR